MKKTIIALMALSGVAAAAPILSTDFTTEPSDWTSGQWNGWNTPHYTFGENGAVIAQPWKQNTLTTDVTLTPDAPVPYTISFTTYGDGSEQSAMFYLTSSTNNYSIVMGNSYNSNNNIAVGTLDQAIVDCTANGQTTQGLVTFQTTGGGASKVHPTVLATSGSTFTSTFKPLTYTLTLQDTALGVSVTDGTNTWSQNFTVQSGVTYDKIGFILDGAIGKAGVKSILITPEPATATLSLLALAGLASRRRRH